jgi:hypothetical protein
VNIPSEIRAGTTVKWRDGSTTDVFGNVVDSSEWTLKYFLRNNSAPNGHTATNGFTSTGSVYLDGWEFTISATDSGGFVAGDWYWEAVASKGSENLSLGYGQLKVNASLSYSGIPSKFDGRSTAKKDLEAVQLAIRTLLNGGAVQEYRIGNRNLKRYDLADLIQLEGRLKAEVKREDQAELIANGLGNPRNMFVRFN